jgi:hypothetical protein
MDRQLENSRKVKDSQKKGFLWVGKRLESEILRGPKIKSPDITGLFIFKLVEAAGIEPAAKVLGTNWKG